MTEKIEYYPLMGGEDLSTPVLIVDPGKARYTRNYELDDDGRFRRIDGYEAFDGRPKPSEASYWKISFDAGTAAIAVGNIVTGAAASGEALVVTVSTGTWAGGDAAGYLILFNVIGTFVDNENLQVSASTKAVANGVATERGADNDTDDTTWLRAAIVATRADIAAVPGSGRILGVWSLAGTKIAFRNNAGDTAAVAYKSSATGWTLCDLGKSVAFTSGGTTEIVVGNTVTGSVSAKTGIVTRVVLTSGTWAGGDAAGTLYLRALSGALQSENLGVGASADLCTIAGDATAITLVKDGRYEFVNYNFGGHSGTFKAYGCDGKNKAFQWDGTAFLQIATGMTTDTPSHIATHKKHLFLSFSGGSVQHSSIGDPFTWSAVTGASEIGIGEEISGIKTVPGEVLAIWGRNSIGLLYGASSEDFNLVSHGQKSGAIEWTIQEQGPVIFLDDRGLTTLSAVQEYGDFSSNAISEPIQSVFDALKKLVQSSITVRSKSQYRIYFTDLQGVCLTLDGNKIVGFTRLLYDKLPVCTCSVEDTDGEEELFFGSTDGFVYQMDSGTSFNGNDIAAYLRTHFNHFKTPRNNKHFRTGTLELEAEDPFTLRFIAEFSYGEETGGGFGISVPRTGGMWDISEWDSFAWDSVLIGTAIADIDGDGTNVAIIFASEGTYEKPHTLQGITISYDLRGIKR